MAALPRLRVFDAFAASLIKPWGDWQRMKILLLGVTGGFSVYILGFSITYYLAEQGLYASSVYFLLLILLGSPLVLPLCYVCMARPWGHAVLATAQIAGLAIILHWPSLAVSSAAAIVLLHMPFWASYHLQFAVNRSHHNHGSETALSALLFLWSGAAGMLAGGWLLEHGLYIWALGGGAVLVVISTQLLNKRLQPASFFRKAWQLMRRRRISTRISILNGAMNSVADYGMPAWMLMVGMSPLVSGAMLAARPILGFLVTPLVGRMAQRGSPRAVKLSGIILALAWVEIGVAVLLTSSPFAFVPGFILLAVGVNLIGPFEVGRWYKTRSAMGIVARESSLTLGRLPAIAMVLPLAFLAPKAYPIAGLFFALLLVLENPVRRRRGGR